MHTTAEGALLRIGVTAGCPAGVGPEIAAIALSQAVCADDVHCIFVGPAALLLRGAKLAGLEASRLADDVVQLGAPGGARTIRCDWPESVPSELAAPGHPDEGAVRLQRDALLLATSRAAAGALDALVTGPIRKRALLDVEGRSFPGQTELVHHYLAKDPAPPLMCFVGGPFVLGLATVHIPLRDVSRSLTEASLGHSLARLAECTSRVTGEERPRLVVLGVNPHAGEGGLLGDDEERVVRPVIARARAEGVDVTGPLAADGFFAHLSRHRAGTAPHGVLAMHHDQGLAPYKLLAGGAGVNLTWGLRVPRTSPDHGTADDIAGQGIADATSMTRALELAAALARTR